MLRYYSTGEYPKADQIEIIKMRKNLASPGEAAKINERNPQPFDEINVKAVTQNRFERRSYDPNQCTKAQQLPFTMNVDVNNNSLHRSKIQHRKMDIEKRNKLRSNVEIG